jgi:hypothetical protein
MFASFFAAIGASAEMGVFAVQASANRADASFEMVAPHLDGHLAFLLESGARCGHMSPDAYPAIAPGSRSLHLLVAFHRIEFRRAFFTKVILCVNGIITPGGCRNPLAGHQT